MSVTNAPPVQLVTVNRGHGCGEKNKVGKLIVNGPDDVPELLTVNVNGRTDVVGAPGPTVITVPAGTPGPVTVILVMITASLGEMLVIVNVVPLSDPFAVTLQTGRASSVVSMQ